MKKVLLAVLALSSAAVAAELPSLAKLGTASDLALCARIGVQSQVTPTLLKRDVRFQLCSSDGQPLFDQVDLTILVQPLTQGFTQGMLSVQGVTTDRQGRFSISYGGIPTTGSVPQRELYQFAYEGRVIASFVLERGPDGLQFYRAPETVLTGDRKNLQDPPPSPAYP